MTTPAPGPPREGSAPRIPAAVAGRAAFTLIELILVMVILAAVLGVAAPSLSRFFQGRNLDSEAHRLVALTRHGQSRAVSEGIPMVLWIDLKKRRYGLEADATWERQDARAASFDLAEDVDIQLRYAEAPATNGTLEIQPETSGAALPSIRFQPDGYFGPASLEWVQLQNRREDSKNDERLWVALGLNRLHYEIWTQQPPLQRW